MYMLVLYKKYKSFQIVPSRCSAFGPVVGHQYPRFKTLW